MPISGTCSAQAHLLVSPSAPLTCGYLKPSLTGRLPLATEEGEVALALATDESCQWLVAGDTAGHISIFNIEQFCTNPHSGVRLMWWTAQ